MVAELGKGPPYPFDRTLLPTLGWQSTVEQLTVEVSNRRDGFKARKTPYPFSRTLLAYEGWQSIVEHSAVEVSNHRDGCRARKTPYLLKPTRLAEYCRSKCC